MFLISTLFSSICWHGLDPAPLVSWTGHKQVAGVTLSVIFLPVCDEFLAHQFFFCVNSITNHKSFTNQYYTKENTSMYWMNVWNNIRTLSVSIFFTYTWSKDTDTKIHNKIDHKFSRLSALDLISPRYKYLGSY